MTKTPSPQNKLIGAVSSVVSTLIIGVALTLAMIASWCVGALMLELGFGRWAAWSAVAMLMLGLPLFWDWSAAATYTQRRLKREQANKPAPWRPKLLTRWGYRAGVINLLALLALWGFAHERGEHALRTRATWPLASHDSSWSKPGKEGFKALANGVIKGQKQLRADSPAVINQLIGTPGEQDKAADALWPSPATPHPLTLSAEAKAPKSMEALAMHLANNEPDLTRRAKAVHDWIATYISYDLQTLKGQPPTKPQDDPEQVFARRVATSSGYARLMTQLGMLAGLDVVTIEGYARDLRGELVPAGHAWNAVKLDGAWRLMDVTWDAGVIKEGKYLAQYRAEYLFTPPAVFGLEHLPDDPHWQLADKMMNKEEFLAQPLLRPSFFASKLELVSPTRSGVKAQSALMLTLTNPAGVGLIAQQVPTPDRFDGEACTGAARGHELTFTCPIKRAGPMWVQLYQAKGPGRFELIGQLQAHGEP